MEKSSDEGMHIDYGIGRSAMLAEFIDEPIQVLVLNTMFFGPQGYLARNSWPRLGGSPRKCRRAHHCEGSSAPQPNCRLRPSSLAAPCRPRRRAAPVRALTGRD